MRQDGGQQAYDDLMANQRAYAASPRAPETIEQRERRQATILIQRRSRRNAQA